MCCDVPQLNKLKKEYLGSYDAASRGENVHGYLRAVGFQLQRVYTK